MNILMLNYEFPPLGGGAAPISYSMAKQLVKEGHSVDVVTAGFKGLPSFEKKEGINIHRVNCLRSKKEICHPHEMLSYVISAYFFTKKLIKNNNYDINHTHFIIPTAIVSYFLRNKLPYVITCHGSDVPGYNPDRFKFLEFVLLPFWKKIVNRSLMVTSPSKFLAKLIGKNSFKRVKVINNGFNPGTFNLNKKNKKILVVTRMFERKGVQYFIESLKGLNLKEWEVNVVGEGPFKKKVLELKEKFGLEVNILGYVSNQKLKQLYEESSIFVFPSIREDFPVVLLEAMNAGCAIITTNSTGCPEVVGDAGIKVKPESPDALKTALTRLMKSPALIKSYGRKSYKRAKQFDWKLIIKEYFKAYKKIGLTR